MNERIRELANQCYRTSGVLGSDSWPAYTTFDEQKFAELLIKECVSIIAKRKDEAIDNEWNVDEAMSMAEIDIEEHFGVE